MSYCLPVVILLCLLFSCKKQDPFIPQPSINKVYGGSQADWGQEIIASGDGGYILAASTNSNNGDVSGLHGNTDFWLVKVDKSGNIIWQRTYGGSDYEELYSMVSSGDGGCVLIGITGSYNGDVTGRAYSPGSTNFLDAWIVKVDAHGKIVWQKAFGGLSHDAPNAIIKSSDGGYVIAGSTSIDDGGFEAWIIKLDGIGNIVWQKRVGGTANDVARSIIEAKGGGYMVTGFTSSNNGDVSGNHGDADVWLFKIDESGNLLWQKTYGGTGPDYGEAVAASPDGGYLLAATTGSKDGDVRGGIRGGSYDGWLVKVDSNGNLQWEKTIGGSGAEALYSIVNIPDEGYAFSGTSSSSDGDVSRNLGSNDVWVGALDEKGNILSQKSYGSSGSDFGNSIIITNGRNFVIGAQAGTNDGDISGGHGRSDAWIISGKF